MLKKIIVFMAMLYAAVCFAAVDVNKATAAELDGIKGIGPAISGRILDERAKGQFKDWNDLITRVKGVGEVNAAKFSAEGLTVGGAGYKTAAAAPAVAKKEDKPAAKTEVKKTEEKPVAAKEAAKDPKAEAKAKAAEAKAKAAEAKAKAAEAKAAEKPAKAEEKAKKGAAPAKPAASAASAVKK